MAQQFDGPIWCRKKRKATKASQTPGKDKGDHCQTGGQKKYFFTHPHAFRHSDYQKWHNEAKRLNNV